MKKSEIWIVAYIYSIICFCIHFGIEEHKSKKLYQDFYQAKVIAVEYHDISNELYRAMDSLNLHIDKMEQLDRLIQDLDRVPRSERKKTIANCYNESNLNYDAIHKGKLDKTTTPICGVKKEWIKAIPELNEDNINSLYGGYLVLNHLLAKHNGNEFKALAEYKGSVTNFFPVYKVLEIKKRIEL